MLRPTPWKVSFKAYGGYDCMSDSYDVRDVHGELVCVVDTQGHGENPEYREVAERIVAAVNRPQEG